MSRWMAAFIIFSAICAQASDDHQSSMEAGILCSDSWYQFIEGIVPTSDNQGHGPDVGSDEWKSVIEFKLGLRDVPNLPERDSVAKRNREVEGRQLAQPDHSGMIEYRLHTNTFRNGYLKKPVH